MAIITLELQLKVLVQVVAEKLMENLTAVLEEMQAQVSTILEQILASNLKLQKTF